MRANIWAAVATAVWACAAAAQDDPLATRGGWEVGLQLSTYEYEEPDFALLEGERIGVSGAYTFLGKERFHSRIEARYSYGELDYTGSGTIADVPDHLFEGRALALWELRHGALMWVPYGGLGFRYLYNDLRGTSSTGAIGYRRESHYFYVPLGVTLRVPLGGRWIMAPQIEYDAFARGSQRSYLADTGLGFSDVTNEQMEGYGVRAQLAFEGPRWSFIVWTNYWDVEDSDIQPIGLGYAGLEPANTTRESGVEVRYRF
ncbi:MAG TPA: outer membrane beta-barrel protein [Burkholderiales bacterium]|nr:outer membrane beta-barrel protein [Burkholderiales bacterium]